MSGKNKLPGIVFAVEYAALTLKRGVVHLGATVEDEDLWWKVLKKLNGLKLYAGVGLQQALFEVLEQDQEQLKKEHVQEVSKLRSELEWAKQRLSLLEQKNVEWERFETTLQRIAKAPVLDIDGVDSEHGTECYREAHGDFGGPSAEGSGCAEGPEEPVLSAPR